MANQIRSTNEECEIDVVNREFGLRYLAFFRNSSFDIRHLCAEARPRGIETFQRSMRRPEFERTYVRCYEGVWFSFPRPPCAVVAEKGAGRAGISGNAGSSSSDSGSTGSAGAARGGEQASAFA